MARPHKMTVDYFPHSCTGGKTLFILQSKYQNDGYAFWFKLLEILGRTEGHCYDYNNPSNWQFLLAQTLVTEDKANSIIKTLVDLDAIDRELAESKIIWCQNFVNNVSDAYKRRQVSLPVRPGNQLVPVDTSDILDPKLASMVKCYEENIRMATPFEYEELKLLCDELPDGWFQDATKEAVVNGVPKLSYIKATLKRWQAEGRNNKKPAPYERQEYTLD